MTRVVSDAPSTAATILWWLRTPGHERQLTDCLGDLARVDAKIGRGLAEALLVAAASHGSAQRAETLLAAMPESISCSREELTGELTRRERSWWRSGMQAAAAAAA